MATVIQVYTGICQVYDRITITRQLELGTLNSKTIETHCGPARGHGPLCIYFHFFLPLFLLSMYGVLFAMYAYAACMPDAPRGQKRESGPLGL